MTIRQRPQARSAGMSTSTPIPLPRRAFLGRAAAALADRKSVV